MSDVSETAHTVRAKPVRIDLALQGGGSHGAFTWGVLDRLLEEPGLQIEGISSTSAGAMNAAVLANGYAGNPPITPLMRESEANDTILVQVNPVERAATPRSAREIINRVNEIAFNAPLLKELRMIALLRMVANPGSAEGRHWAAMRMHRIYSSKMQSLSYSSKLNAEWAFVLMLRDEGRRAADAVLSEHGACLGRRSSFDFDELLDGVVQ